jgi:dTDP-4-dehydrorhamnose 3,5-epimerase
MGFKKSETGFDGLWLLEPAVMGDARGWFMESWSAKAFSEIGLEIPFVQDNVSYSAKNILRGLHFQTPPHAQGKLVQVLIGAVLDVAVDIRKSSATYGKAYSIELSGDNHKMLYVPPGFAHGFRVLSDSCLFSYKCAALYNRESEGGLMWNDPSFEIDWGISDPLLSDKDRNYAPFSSFISPFE